MKPKTILTLAVLAGISSSQAALINLNYNGGGDAPVESTLSGPAGGLATTWNSVTSSGDTGALQDSGDNPTTVSVNTSGYDGSPSLGNQTVGDLPVYRSFLSSFSRPGAYSVTISGLASEGLYDIWLLSYRDATNPLDPSVGTWTADNTTTSSISQLVDAQDVSTPGSSTFTEGYNYVLFSNVEATVGGVISFTGVGDPGDTGRRLHLNGLQINQVPEPSSAALLGLGGLALILRRRK
jgi:hypothetical protein